MFEQDRHTSFRQFFRERRVGIYATISVHLVVVIIFLLYHIGHIARLDTFFVIDFSQQEAIEAQQEKEERRKTFEEELDRIMAPTRHNELRNVAVDKSDQTLRDDRHTNPSAIYEEAQRVQERLDASRRAAQQQQGGDVPIAAMGNNNTTTQARAYSGPSVLSYDLGGRKAMQLPVPVYQCRNGGDVTVLIEVDQRGYVVSATSNVRGSVDDSCLRDAAERAARTSRFAADANAPARQKGHIVYRFVRQ